MLILHSSHQQKQRFIRFLVYFLLILIPIVHYWWINIYKPVVITFGHLKTVEETLHSNNGIVLDTYFRRIKQFLDKRNVSLLSYEQSSKIDDNLLSDIKKEILNLRQKQEQELLKIKNSEEISHGCEKSCCWSKKKMRKFYYGEKDYFPTVLDRLSQIDLKLLADLHYGTLRVPDGIQLSKLTSDLLPCLQNHTIIFVDTSELRHFLRNFHEKISVDYILMTGDSDLPCPFYLKHTHSHLLEQIFAGKTHILHWFSMNCHFGTNEQWKQSKILTCIPQGISQWLNQRYYCI
ncbi:hypothetical protein I4U23_030623 [Adineta vaga]|nr:hypothetical protein I4U23_030623 [Adineta vaga]